MNNSESTTFIGSFLLAMISMILSLIITGILGIIIYLISRTRLHYYTENLYFYEKDIKIV